MLAGLFLFVSNASFAQVKKVNTIVKVEVREDSA